MRVVVRILSEIFDFFCGDWRIFWGVAVTIFLVAVIAHEPFVYSGRIAGLVFIVGLSLSLLGSLKRETRRWGHRAGDR